MTGGAIPGLSRPAFTLHRGSDRALPVIIAVPHAGRAYAPDLLAALRHGEISARRLEDRHVDAIGRAAAAAIGASLMVAHAPRALIDLNRDPGDLDPGMFTGWPKPAPGSPIDGPRSRSLRGLGLFPRRLPGIGELWRRPMNQAEADRRIAGVHAPWHQQLASELAAIRGRHGAALLIDLHSMPGLPPGGRAAPPSYVIGDRFGASCAGALAADALDLLDAHRIGHAYNRPYAGGYTLDRHGNPRGGVHAIQLEIDRARYLDPAGGLDSNAVAREGGLLAELAQRLARRLTGQASAAPGDPWPLDEAAE